MSDAQISEFGALFSDPDYGSHRVAAIVTAENCFLLVDGPSRPNVPWNYLVVYGAEIIGNLLLKRI